MPSRQSARTTWAVIPALVVVGWLYLVVTGVDPLQSLRLTGVVALQGIAGGIVWRSVRRGPIPVVEQAGVGLAIGTTMSLVAGLAVTTLGWGGWGWALPVVASFVWSLATRRCTRGAWVAPDQASAIGLAVTFVVGLGSLIPNIVSYPLTWTGAWSRYHPDMLFFESLATSFSRLGPLDSIFTPDGMVRYHWLVYAWSGQVAEAAGAEPFVVLTRVLPFVAVVGSCLVAVAWARRMSTVIWVPALAVVLLVAGGYVGATYGAVFNFDSPSQSLTTLWLLAMCFAIVMFLSERPTSFGGRVGAAVVVGLLSFSLAGGKISAGAIGLAAVLWIAVVGLIRRTPWRGTALWLAGAALAAFVLGYFLVVAGSAGSGGLKLANLIDRASSIQGLNPIQGSLGIVLGTLILALAISVRWAGLVWFLADRERRWAPETVLGTGLALAAVTTVLLISGGMNDTWFALAASAPLAVISAAGAGEAWQSLGPRRWTAMAWSAAAAIVIFVLVAVLWSTGASGGTVWVGTLRWLGPLVGAGAALVLGVVIGRRFGVSGGRSGLAGAVIVLVLLSAPGRALGVGSGQVGVQPGLGADAFSPIESFTSAIDRTAVTEWSDQHVAAASWLRERAGVDDLVATNVTFSPFVPALTGLRTYASGILYQAPYGLPSGVPVLLDREAQSWAFITEPSAATVQPLCAAGVRWVWVDPTRTEVRDWTPYASVVFENEAAVVLALDPSRCSVSG